MKSDLFNQRIDKFLVISLNYVLGHCVQRRCPILLVNHTVLALKLIGIILHYLVDLDKHSSRVQRHTIISSYCHSSKITLFKDHHIMLTIMLLLYRLTHMCLILLSLSLDILGNLSYSLMANLQIALVGGGGGGGDRG